VSVVPRLIKLALVMCLLLTVVPQGATQAARGADRYRNPLAPSIAGGGQVESCADPVVLRGRGEHRRRWYMFCTTDPLNDAETAPAGRPRFHPIPMLVSRDLVTWRYVGDALPSPPAWAAPGAALWAPDLVYSRATDRYYLTFVVTDTRTRVSGEPGCDSDSAIGVATSRSPTGPWRVSGTPVVPPRRNGAGCDFFWTYDPDVLGDSVGSRSVLYYGSYYGGVFGQRATLTRDGITLTGHARRITDGQDRKPAYDPVDQRTRPHVFRALAGRRALTIPNRYEGTNVVRRGDWYYYFGSATNCCNGPLTGYSVFAGRSRSPLGPFRDREGNSLLAGRVGGTPVLSMNGNRWVGLGHNSVFQDRAGRWWTAYHAVNRFDPYFTGEPGFTKRPALLDPVTWAGGWPSVRAGRWASTTTMPAPAAQPGERSRYRPRPVAPHRTGRLLPRFSDEFAGARDRRWRWVRRPGDRSSFGVEDGRFRFDVQARDIYVDSRPRASVLARPAPRRDFVVQAKLSFDAPAEGCCFNFAQAGLVLYGSDDSFVKLTHASIHETRQTEWAKEVPRGLTRYGNAVVGPPGDETWLRIVASGSRFTAYTSQDGRRWVRGGTWVHRRLVTRRRIGLVSMGAEEPVPFSARFDHVRVWTLRR
jgi:arabinan endo-1,5-alpha-L-arabinosidase